VCYDVMRASARPVEEATNYVVVARAVERIGDHAKNIAEEVIFVVEGAIVRHNVEAPVVKSGS
jgi:phosphate transport system protein